MNIKRTLKRLIDDTQYVAALEKQNDLLKENLQQEKDNLQKQKEDFRKEKEQKVADEEAQYKKRSRNYLRPIADMQKWLLENYEFRYNVITDVSNTARRRSMTSKSSTSMPSTPSPSKCRRLASLCAITS